MNLQEFQRLKQQFDQAHEQAIESQGALKTILMDIEGEFGTDLAGAKKMLNTERKQIKKLEDRYDDAMQRFLQKWKDYL